MLRVLLLLAATSKMLRPYLTCLHLTHVRNNFDQPRQECHYIGRLESDSGCEILLYLLPYPPTFIGDSVALNVVLN